MNFHFLWFVPKFIESVTISQTVQQLETVQKSQWLNTTRRFLDIHLVQAELTGALLSSHSGARQSELLPQSQGNALERGTLHIGPWNSCQKHPGFTSAPISLDITSPMAILNFKGTRKGNPTSKAKGKMRISPKTALMTFPNRGTTLTLRFSRFLLPFSQHLFNVYF